MDDLLKKVPKELRPCFTEIVAIIDRFCDQHLDDEYKELCRKTSDDDAILCRFGHPTKLRHRDRPMPRSSHRGKTAPS
jgi:hypothetical protein